jgi:PT repeat
VRTKIWIVAFVVSLAFAAACNGQVGDAVSSIASGTALPSVSRSISLPTRSDAVATPSDVPSEAPTETPSEEPSEEPSPEPSPEPSEAPTAEPTEEPTEAPSEQPTETPTEAPTEEPTPVESESAAPSGEASSGTSATLWWLLGIAIVVAVAVWLIVRRRRPSATLQDAYAATAAARDRLALEASAPSATPGGAEALLDQADQKLRAAQVAAGDQAGRAAVDHSLSALAEAREALALRAASTGAAHVSGPDIEARLLRSLAALDAALGALRTASGGDSGSTTGFEG